MMKLRALGSSDLKVSPIGLGCWQFSKGVGIVGRYWPELPDLAAREIVQKSILGGVNWFDTAEAYGWGTSEQTLTSALSSLGKRGGEVIIASKWWPALRTSRSILRTIDERLRRLGGFPLDLYQVHQPLGFSSVEKEMDAMARLAERGKIRYIGVSNFNEKRMRRADARLRHHGLRLISNQMSYSLLNRAIELNGVLPSARELGISIIAYSPLSQGLLSGKFHAPHGASGPVTGIRRYLRSFSRSGLERTRPLVNLLDGIARAHGVTPAQVALQWLISFHGDCVVAIPGATSPRHAEENAAAMTFELSTDDLGVLEAESRKIAPAFAG
jgi:aryl-alcohol dehydrogenase-like predicted oxidoreductase